MAFMRVKETAPRHKCLITGNKPRILDARNRHSCCPFPGRFADQWRSGLAYMAPMLRSEIPSVELKEENMRASMLAFAGIFVCSASAASAQAVIDVEGRRAAQPPAQDQPAAQPQPQVVPQVAPQPTPKVESPVQPNDDDCPKSRRSQRRRSRVRSSRKMTTLRRRQAVAGSRSIASTTGSCGSTRKTARLPIAARRRPAGHARLCPKIGPNWTPMSHACNRM